MRAPAPSRHVVLAGIALALVVAGPARAADPQIEELKAQIRVLMERVEQLEKERQAPATAPASVPAGPATGAAAAATQAAPSPVATAPVASVPATGPAPDTVAAIPAAQESAVRHRQSLNDQQEAAPRADDLTLDPKYRGFVPVPNTPVLIKFNAKPRVDATWDSENAGDDSRFVTAKIPVDGDPDAGGDGAFNINAKGSQLRIDVRAPEVAGKPRFYYENDFFGSGGGEFPYRVRHLYGKIYNVIVGQTYSVFEDPDVWPDTVDYEGPNSAVFARRPLIRYQYGFAEEWQLNLGLEQPESEIDTTNVDADASGRNDAPDGGFNVRWERDDVGHVQFATMLRDLGVDGPTAGDQNALGWGLNLSSGFDVGRADSVQAQLTYGQGIFRFVNDDFQNLDAAFDAGGDLEAIPYLGLMLGYTHHWNEAFRSTASYGFVTVDNTWSQPGDTYHETHYASINLMWQIRRRLSVGLEELYGRKETIDGSDGQVFRTQLGLVYSIFD